MIANTDIDIYKLTQGKDSIWFIVFPGLPFNEAKKVQIKRINSDDTEIDEDVTIEDARKIWDLAINEGFEEPIDNRKAVDNLS